MSATSVPLQSVGRALARITSLHGPRPASVGTGGDSRAAVLAFIEESDDVVRVEQVAEAVGLHPNTVRGHLDALLAAGQIVRSADQRATRGRPHWLYSATATASIRELARALDAELERASAPDVARAAAAIWAQVGPEMPITDSVEAAVDVATETMNAFGFEAARNPVGDEITLKMCPYAALVHEHPVICEIHAELLGEVLARTGQPVTLSRLDVFPRPGLCVAHLDRPDVSPEWSVELASTHRPRSSTAPVPPPSPARPTSPVPPTLSPRKK